MSRQHTVSEPLSSSVLTGKSGLVAELPRSDNEENLATQVSENTESKDVENSDDVISETSIINKMSEVKMAGSSPFFARSNFYSVDTTKDNFSYFHHKQNPLQWRSGWQEVRHFFMYFKGSEKEQTCSELCACGRGL